MATIQEIIAKRKELGANATNVEARQALMGTPTTTPVTQAVPTTPSPVTPQPIVNAPVDQTTGLSKPLAPAQSTQTEQDINKQYGGFIQDNGINSVQPKGTQDLVDTSSQKAPAKIVSDTTVDYNVSAGREGEIQGNVAKITQTNPNLLKDRNAFNQAFGYETADAGKKALLDSTFSGQVKPSQDDIFNSMRQGVSVGDPKSTEFRQAQARMATFKKYSVYDTASLATSLQSGDLLVGTKAYNDLVSDPTMALKIQKAQAFNKGVVDLVKTGETQMANVLAQNPTVAQALEDGNLSKAEYDQLTNNAEVSAQGKLVEANKTKYETIKAQYDAVENDVNTEYTGKEVTDSFKAKITADRRKGMYKDYQIASLEYQNSLGTYTNLKADSTALLAQNMELYKTEQANKAEIAKEQRATENALALSQAQFDQKLAQQAQLTNDPNQAIPEIISQYAQQGIFASKSAQQHIADFTEQNRTKGTTLGEYISQMQKDFQAKDAYKAKFGVKPAEETAKWGVIGKNTDGSDKYGFIDATKKTVTPYLSPTGEVTGDIRYLADQFPNQAWAKNNNPAGITWNSNFDKGTGTAKLLTDAGVKFSKGTARPANEGGNYVTFATIEDGLKAQQIMMTQTYGNSTVGNMLSSWVGTSEGPNYAKQVAGMAGITDLNQKVSDLSPEQVSALQMAKIQKESPGLAKLLTQGTGTQSPSSTQTQYTDDVIAVLALAGDMTNTAEAKKTLKENGLTTQDLARFKAGTIPATAGQKTQASNVVSQIDDMLSGDALSDAVGMAKTPSMFGGTERKDFEAKFASFRDNLALSNIDKLKGAMSDKDIEFLRNTASSLNLDMSEAEFIKQLNSIKQKYSNIAGGLPANKTQSNTAPFTMESLDNEWLNFKP